MNNCNICSILPALDEAFVLYDGQFWNANLRENDQTLLGTTFITAKRHVPELDFLTDDEEHEYIIIRNALITAIRSTFQPLTFNVSCLKNDAFRTDPDNTPTESSHVHWHLKPRYGTQPVRFAGETFTDPFPGQYLRLSERHIPMRPTAIAIADAIRSHL